jgi:hypothetical protein
MIILKLELWRLQGGICPWCSQPLGRDFTVLEADHIIPKCRGGPHKIWNRQLLHMSCNRRKSYRLTDEARALAAEHGVILREPKPTAWPGSSVRGGGSARPLPLTAPLMPSCAPE